MKNWDNITRQRRLSLKILKSMFKIPMYETYFRDNSLKSKDAHVTYREGGYERNANMRWYLEIRLPLYSDNKTSIFNIYDIVEDIQSVLYYTLDENWDVEREEEISTKDFYIFSFCLIFPHLDVIMFNKPYAEYKRKTKSKAIKLKIEL